MFSGADESRKEEEKARAAVRGGGGGSVALCCCSRDSMGLQCCWWPVWRSGGLNLA